MSVGESEPIVTEERQAALEAVLSSETFSRSAQLRRFLRYVCESAIAGRSDEINEYAIGIEALGRQPGYSLAEDSAVRSRAYELRQRLEKYYTHENPNATILISIPKGSYVPVFARAGAGVPTTRHGAGRDRDPDGGARVSHLAAHRTGRSGRRAGERRVDRLVDALVRLASRSAFRRSAGGVGARWFYAGDDDTLICVATKMHLLVRPNLPRSSTDLRFAALPELYPLFRRHRPLAEGEKLLDGARR